MNFAAIETATEWCSVALWRDGEILSLERRAGNRQGEFVLPMLETLFRRANLGMADLDAIAFGAGPGAFTGLRIACGVAQGLAFSRNLPVIGVSTLEATAEESGAARVVVALDARMHEVYYSAYEKRDGGWLAALPETCVAPEMAEIPPGAGWIGCGNGFSVYADRLGPRLAGRLERIAPELRPSASAVARLAAPRLAAGEGLDAALATPHYIRDKIALTSSEQGKGK
ncbi:MAG: tRNA (adenosine(37)-N6)-threonylcarbamoyltransferase complex dimerization subunit type 1 TsaB [Proteobacteria bacterium]|nr:tRNA (adenosine(37)-N6)-threonylcarbamoyltransferase complex dimerization subunit type 1 TsaB [Pseudomonadota bacterium]